MPKHSLDRVGLFFRSLTIGAVTAAAQRVHHAVFEQRDGWIVCAVGVRRSIPTQLSIAGPVPLLLNAPALPNQT
ncbi:MAG: hypothetical protein RLZZ117_1766 [Cyanobacteriota bacterium]